MLGKQTRCEGEHLTRHSNAAVLETWSGPSKMRLTERLKAQTWEPAFLGLDSALQLMSWGTLGKLLNLSVSFSHLLHRASRRTFICKVLKPMPSQS